MLLLVSVVGLLFLPMSGILFYSSPMTVSIKDNIRVSTERTEHTDYSSTDITAFTNTEYVFYVPPPVTKSLERPSVWYGFQYRSGEFVMANLSSIQIFSYENGASVKLEWLNATVIDKAVFDAKAGTWSLKEGYSVEWMEHLAGAVKRTERIDLKEYSSWEFALNNWAVNEDFRVLSGTIRVTSDYPISVMHHKLCPSGSKYNNGEDKINYYWDGVYSAYTSKLYTRIARDCWISALEAHTTVHVWDFSDKNDEAVFELDRFEGWSYTRNPIFEQYGFDDDNVLISADKPLSIVAGIQADQCFLQVYGKDSKDFHFPCFGQVLIHAPDGATIELEDTNGNQGSFEGTMGKGEMRTFDFKVAYKLRGYSSFEWATLRSSKPVKVYTLSNNQWYLNEESNGLISGEEYLTTDRATTTFYPFGKVPYPAATDYRIPLYGRAYVTVVNLEEGSNDVKVDFDELYLPFKKRLAPYETVTMEYSEDSYYYMDMIISDTGYNQPPEWNYKDPQNRFMLDSVPRIAVDRGLRDKIFLSDENITKGSLVKVSSDGPVMVFINYDRDTLWAPQGVDLIPGLTPPTYRGLPDLLPTIVAIAGAAIIMDMIAVAIGWRSIADIALKGIVKKGGPSKRKAPVAA